MEIKDNKVYVVVYSFTNLDCSTDNYITTKVFSSEEKAEEYLRKDYEEAVSEYTDEESVRGIINAENYGNNAEITTGDITNECTETIHEWRVHTNTIDID